MTGLLAPSSAAPERSINVNRAGEDGSAGVPAGRVRIQSTGGSIAQDPPGRYLNQLKQEGLYEENCHLHAWILILYCMPERMLTT